MAYWPTNIPGLGQNYSEVRKNNLIRSAMSIGPDKVRRRSTAVIKDVNSSIVVTEAERVIFDTFFDTILKGGSLSFIWRDPISGTDKSFRFKDMPKYTLINPGSLSYSRIWQIDLPLEILP